MREKVDRLLRLWLAAVMVGVAYVEAAVAQANRGEWKSYTDMKSVRDLAANDEALAAATAGGLFFYSFAGRKFTQVTNTDGLGSNDLTAITILPNGEIWTGSGDGVLNYFRDKTWRRLNDIKESTRIQKGIRRFLVAGDTLFIGTDFGVVVYRLDRMEFGDTFANMGFMIPTRINDMRLRGRSLWVATDQGVAVASLDHPNPSSPSAWTRYQSGLPSVNVLSLEVFRDTVVAGTSLGLAYLRGSSFQSVSSFSSRSVADILAEPSRLVVLSNSATGFSVEALSDISSSAQLLAQATGSAGVLQYVPGMNQIVAGTVARGIYLPPNDFLFPNGPQSNLFISVATDESGVVWAASGISDRGTGFYRYNPSLPADRQWKNFTVGSFPIMADDDYYKVSVAGGSVWVSSWGYGVVEVVKDTVRRRIDHTSSPRLAGSVPQNPSFVVVGSVAADPQGAVWFVNRTAITGNYLAKLSSDTSFTYYQNSLMPTEGRFTAMVVDRYGTKWIASAEPHNKPATGLWLFNEERRVAGTETTGGWGNITSADGLPHNDVLSLAIDLNGDVCVGTNLGMMIITDPLQPRSRTLTSFPLREQVIQTIAVDALNNKWVGTREGVFVVSFDGTQLLQQYSVLTTGGRLLDDDVRSIAIDQQRGIVYFGTEKGLSSLAIDAVRTVPTLTTLTLGPNPFLIPNPSSLVIGNLVANSTIKVLTTAGALVSQFAAQGGGRAFWDGRASDGEFVASGVYLIVAFAENGSQIATGKVAVIRR